MPDEEQKKPEKPYRMSRIAWPNAKYGLYLALIIIKTSEIRAIAK